MWLLKISQYTVGKKNIRKNTWKINIKSFSSCSIAWTSWPFELLNRKKCDFSPKKEGGTTLKLFTLVIAEVLNWCFYPLFGSAGCVIFSSVLQQLHLDSIKGNWFCESHKQLLLFWTKGCDLRSKSGWNMSGGLQTFKVVLLGEGCVGKTSCVVRYVEDQFNDRHVTTLQVFLE